MKLFFETQVSKSFREVYDAFDRQLFEKMAMPPSRMILKKFDGKKKGDEVEFFIEVGSIQKFWSSLIVENTESEEEIVFVDVGKNIPRPLSSWSHRHSFKKLNDGGCLIVDDVEFHCRPKIMEYIMIAVWYPYFLYRQSIYRKVFR
ncbi:MAG: hypothetical protein H6621_08110 [Halobacteriovoraceae bacterium]|nr:hypothetical protein [Halobacteriovoraceae bacterium]